jgi:hypothetical protein
MTDEELKAVSLPLLKELVNRHMIYGEIQTGPAGVWVISAVVEADAHGLLLVVSLEDDAASIASATFM